MKTYLLAAACICLSACGIREGDPAPVRTQEPLDQMRNVLEGAEGPLHYFQAGRFFVAVHADDRTAERVRRYTGSLLEAMKPFFREPSEPVKMYVFSTRKTLRPHINAICETKRTYGDTMGFYHPPTRSGLLSMEWGLGWMGDILFQAMLHDDWKTVGAKPNAWFRQSFVSMLYNCFRTAEGEFQGLNVMSYYRPQAQQLMERKRLVPLKDFLHDRYGGIQVSGNGVRVQGREFLAYLHSRGLLAEFYARFRETGAQDPSGLSAVEAVTGRPIEEVEADWRLWLAAADGEIGDSAMSKPFPALGVLIARKVPDDAAPGISLFEVCPFSPAQRGGLRSGDRILEIDGRAVNSRGDLLTILRPFPIGTVATLTLERDGKRIDLRVALDRYIDG